MPFYKQSLNYFAGALMLITMFWCSDAYSDHVYDFILFIEANRTQ